MPTFKIMVFGVVSLVFEPVTQRNKNTVEPQCFTLATFPIERDSTTEEVYLYANSEIVCWCTLCTCSTLNFSTFRTLLIVQLAFVKF